MVRIIQAVYVIVDTQQAIDVQGFNQKTRRGRGVGPLLSCKIKFKSCFFLSQAGYPTKLLRSIS